MDFIKDTTQFYEQVAFNLDQALDQSKAIEDLPRGDNIVLLQHVSDIHCNVGMARINGAVARGLEVDLTIDTGDSTMSGTEAEEECINSEANAIPNEIVWERGNHDSEVTARQARDAGMIIIDDAEPIEVKGITFMGLGDPRRSMFGSPIEQIGDEDTKDHAAILKEAACSAETTPDILLTHSPAAILDALRAGCASLGLSGHTHQMSGPNLLNLNKQSYQFTQSSSGGVAESDISFGRLKAPAVQTIFTYDTKEHRLLGYIHITANPDTSVTISDYTNVDIEPTEFATVEVPQAR
jgi:hypothetical protein